MSVKCPDWSINWRWRVVANVVVLLVFRGVASGEMGSVLAIWVALHDPFEGSSDAIIRLLESA